MNISDSILPHGSEPVTITGNIKSPTKALILLHGRGASGESILNIINQITLSDEYIVIAPNAYEHTWYPQRFIVPQEQNQPYLDSALGRVNSIIHSLKNSFNINSENIIIGGFSQGACLVAEYLKQYPQKYKGVVIFSGGLIGSDNEVSQNISGDLHNTPVYLGCDELDFHIPKERIILSSGILNSMNADVNMKLYTDLGHAIHPEGLQALLGFINN